MRRSVHAPHNVHGRRVARPVARDTFVVVGVTPKVMQRFTDGCVRTTPFDVDAGVMVAIGTFRLGLVARNLTTPSFDG